MERSSEGGTITKLDFKLKSKPRDGEILQLHHTVRGSSGEPKRIRFISAAFQDASERLACSDLAGNLFILDFSALLFWKLGDIGPSSCLHFSPEHSDIVVAAAANSNFNVRFLNVESGEALETLSGHTAAVKHISFSSSKIGNLLTSSPIEAIIWELKNFTKYFTLHTYKGAFIQKIMFAPVCDNLVACFQNDTVQLWKQDTMKTIKQIIPSELKHMKSIAFTANGRAMAMAGLTPTVILFSLDTWKAIKSIDLSRFNISGVKEIAFIPQVFDGGSNKVLSLLGSDCILRIFDLESLSMLHTVSTETSVKNHVVSPTGKYFACVLQMGEVNIYNSSHVMDIASSTKVDVMSAHGEESKELRRIFSGHTRIDDEERDSKMRVCLDGARLRRILSQYSEYPEQYRSIIWRALLNTPRNKNAYLPLVNKPIHSAFMNIEREFTIHSAVTLKNLKRLLSCLAHWCPLFGVMRFLPGFVFPFVRVLQKDPLLLFESVASILINYCQLWFEYAPFPPINVLAIVENVLGEHDKPLLEHFCKYGVTNQTYALTILETAFSEVLTGQEWLVLWDHILSNEPAFILIAVVSYNIVQRNALKKLTSQEDFEDFFHTQNPLDKKGFLKKCYTLLNSTSDDIHPRRFLSPFVAMEKGLTYPQFDGYPKATVCLKLVEEERKKTTKDFKKMSLKDLTAKSQEKELSQRYCGAEKSTQSNSGSVSEDEFCSGDEIKVVDNSNKQRREEADKSSNKGEVKDKSHGDQTVDNIVTKDNDKNDNTEMKALPSDRDVLLVKNMSHSSTGPKHRRKQREEENLEQEVQKLMKKLSETEF